MERPELIMEAIPCSSSASNLTPVLTHLTKVVTTSMAHKKFTMREIIPETIKSRAETEEEEDIPYIDLLKLKSSATTPHLTCRCDTETLVQGLIAKRVILI